MPGGTDYPPQHCFHRMIALRGGGGSTLYITRYKSNGIYRSSKKADEKWNGDGKTNGNGAEKNHGKADMKEKIRQIGSHLSALLLLFLLLGMEG